jgi:TonB family protein
MILEHYGLSGQPFGATPDPRFLYASDTHREALASLQYAVHSGRGFTSLIAPPGLGKTTLLFRLLEDLEGQASTAFVFQTQCKSRELLRFILNELSIQAPGSDLVSMHNALNDHLIAQARAGQRCVIVLDEAQNLNDSALEAVRLLSDFETPKQKLLHIVLSGQPELANKLLRPGLRQLQQRIGSVCKLRPLTPEEIEQYVEHRLAMAGHSGPSLFTPAAMAIIKHFSRGVPRNVNALCFAALSLGYALNKKHLDAHILEEAASDLSFESPRQGDFLLRKREEVGELPKEPLATEAEATVHQPSTQKEQSAAENQAVSQAAPPAMPIREPEEQPVRAPAVAGDATVARARTASPEDPVARLEEEERTKREHKLDPLDNIDLSDYALLSGTERRRIRYEAYQPHDFNASQKAISRVDDEPDPELEVLKKHLGQATTNTIAQKSSTGAVLAVAAFAAVLIAIVLISLLWMRTDSSLAYSPRSTATLPPSESAAPAAGPAAIEPERETKTHKVSSVPGHSRAASLTSPPAAPIANASTPAELSPNGRTVPSGPQVVRGTEAPSSKAVFTGPYAPLPAAPNSANAAESGQPKPTESAEPKHPTSTVDVSQPGDAPVYMVPPVYPTAAKALRLAGTVVLHVDVDKNGRVVGIQKITGDPRLTNAAIAAVQQWVYQPLVVGGKKQFARKQIQIDFKLPPDTQLPSGDSSQ